MDAMTYAYSFREEKERSYYDSAIHPSNAPIFTQQELYGFEPVHQSIYESNMAMPEEKQTGWHHAPVSKPGQYMCGIEPGYMGYDVPEQFYGTEYSLDPNAVYMNAPEFYAAPSDCFAGSCQASPIYNPAPFTTAFVDYSHPVSPITPSGSPPHAQYDSCLNKVSQTAPSEYVMNPANSGHYQQYNAFEMPMAASLSPENSQGHIPVHNGSPYEPQDQQDREEEEEEEEYVEEEEDVLPHHGNKELRGMGLYDDTPGLMWDDPSVSPGGYSPITPHDQLRPVLGKGLVLEKSFGLPEEMMMKDETSGKIVKGKIEVEEC